MYDIWVYMEIFNLQKQNEDYDLPPYLLQLSRLQEAY